MSSACESGCPSWPIVAKQLVVACNHIRPGVGGERRLAFSRAVAPVFRLHRELRGRASLPIRLPRTSLAGNPVRLLMEALRAQTSPPSLEQAKELVILINATIRAIDSVEPSPSGRGRSKRKGSKSKKKHPKGARKRRRRDRAQYSRGKDLRAARSGARTVATGQTRKPGSHRSARR
jgi:hypothetical protein